MASGQAVGALILEAPYTRLEDVGAVHFPSFLVRLILRDRFDSLSRIGAVKAPLLAINSADDLINPPELGLMEKLMPRVAHGKYVLLAITSETRGHGTHSWPVIWQGFLKDWLAGIEQPPPDR